MWRGLGMSDTTWCAAGAALSTVLYGTGIVTRGEGNVALSSAEARSGVVMRRQGVVTQGHRGVRRRKGNEELCAAQVVQREAMRRCSRVEHREHGDVTHGQGGVGHRQGAVTF